MFTGTSQICLQRWILCNAAYTARLFFFSALLVQHSILSIRHLRHLFEALHLPQMVGSQNIFSIVCLTWHAHEWNSFTGTCQICLQQRPRHIKHGIFNSAEFFFSTALFQRGILSTRHFFAVRTSANARYFSIICRTWHAPEWNSFTSTSQLFAELIFMKRGIYSMSFLIAQNFSSALHCSNTVCCQCAISNVSFFWSAQLPQLPQMYATG